MLVLGLAIIAFVPMIAEAIRSSRHGRTLRAAGAVEPSGDVYAAMQFAYPLSFAAMIVEAYLRGRTMSPVALAGAAVFVLAKVLKYWAIVTLGPRWTFRVLVPPGSDRTRSGPYRYLRHPNYVAVVGELTGMALISRASITGPVAIVFFGALILLRIRVEEHALGLRRG